MRVAFVDLVFSWPPNGGADIDLYHVLQRLQAAGHEVRLFGVHERGSYERDSAPDGDKRNVERFEVKVRGLHSKKRYQQPGDDSPPDKTCLQPQVDSHEEAGQGEQRQGGGQLKKNAA